MPDKSNNILLLVLDSLRSDRLSCYGYDRETTPFLDSLADEATKYTNLYSTGPWTVPVHGTLFSGLLPSYHGSHRKSKRFTVPPDSTLSSLLGASGYATAGFSANPWISPEFGYDAGFDHFEYVDSVPPFPDVPVAPDGEIGGLLSPDSLKEISSWLLDGDPGKKSVNGFWRKFMSKEYVDGDHVNDAIVDWIDTSDASRRFMFANYMDVHDPHYRSVFDALPGRQDGSLSLSSNDSSFGTLFSKRVDFLSEPDDPDVGHELYDRSLRRLDEQLKELFSKLEGLIDLEETLTIIVGDHGECVGEHGYWGHGTYLYDELLQVPLIVDTPSQSELDPLPSDRPVSMVELAEYVADQTGRPFGELDDGTNGSADGPRPVYAECTGPRPNMEGIASADGYRAVIYDGWKLVKDVESGETQISPLSLSSGHAEPSDEVRETLGQLQEDRWQGQAVQENDDEAEMSADTKRRLSELGYL